MAAVAPLSMSLVSPSKESAAFARYASNSSEYGLSDVHSSPSTCPRTPESFVVTPDGKALPGIRELHVDDAGYLHVVDRAPEHESIFESPPVMRPRRAVPRIDFQQRVHSAWPQIAWRPALDEDEDRRNVQIFEVDPEGIARVRTVPVRAYEKLVLRDRTEDLCFVVEENGTARLAHAVYVHGHNSSVTAVLRDDDDHGGIFDSMPTPSPTLAPFSEIVFVVEPNGCTHYGMPVMIASSRSVSIVCRVARWPTFVPACSASKKYIQYQPRPRIGWRAEARHNKAFHNDCSSYYEVKRGNSTEVYTRILLAGGDGVLLAYRAASNADLVVVSDGDTVSVRCLVKQPSLTPDMDPVFIAKEDCGPSHLSVNILVPSPNGFVPVARKATVPAETKAKLQEGLAHDSPLLFLSWPHPQLRLQSHPHKCSKAATRTRLDRLASDLAGRVLSSGPPLLAPVAASRQRIIVGRLALAGTKSVLPAPAAWDGVILGGDGPLKLGHSVIRLSYDSRHSDISFVPNDSATT